MRTALRQLLIAGPNLTLDRTLSVDEFVPGATVEPSGVAVTPGGKGVNVARAARELGSLATTS